MPFERSDAVESSVPSQGGLIKKPLKKQRLETPSDAGLSLDARERLDSLKRERKSGIFTSSKEFKESGHVQKTPFSSSWRKPTPVKMSEHEKHFLTETPKIHMDQDFMDWDEEQKQLDRDWYNTEEAGAVDETHNAFSDLDGYYKRKEEKAKREMTVITFTNCRKK